MWCKTTGTVLTGRPPVTAFWREVFCGPSVTNHCGKIPHCKTYTPIHSFSSILLPVLVRYRFLWRRVFFEERKLNFKIKVNLICSPCWIRRIPISSFPFKICPLAAQRRETTVWIVYRSRNWSCHVKTAMFPVANFIAERLGVVIARPGARSENRPKCEREDDRSR
jgi:hypothetical protein